jgi:hypothetical protein
MKEISAFMHATYLSVDEPMWAVGVVDILLECEKLLEEETRASDIVGAEPSAGDAYKVLTRDTSPLKQLTWKHKLFLLIFALTLFLSGMRKFASEFFFFTKIPFYYLFIYFHCYCVVGFSFLSILTD